MNLMINLIRILTAVIASVSAILLSILTILKTHQDQGQPSADHQCVRCSEARKGGIGQFHYSESIGNARERSVNKQRHPGDTPMIGTETLFVCDSCSRRYLNNEILQLVMMVLSYPLYLFVITPLFFKTGFFVNFLVETLLIVLSIAGAISAFDLFRAARSGESPLAEARDRVAIHQRKNILGKKFSYYTRAGVDKLKK